MGMEIATKETKEVFCLGHAFLCPLPVLITTFSWLIIISPWRKYSPSIGFQMKASWGSTAIKSEPVRPPIELKGQEMTFPALLPSWCVLHVVSIQHAAGTAPSQMCTVRSACSLHVSAVREMGGLYGISLSGLQYVQRDTPTFWLKSPSEHK